MEIEYQLSKKDYFIAGKLYLRDLLQKRPWGFILLVVFFIIALSGNTKELWRFLFSIIVSPVIVFVILYLIPLLISLIRLNKAFAKDKSGLEKKRLAITDEGLLIESESKTQIRKWESIVSAQSTGKFIYLILADKKYIPIPKSAFPSESEAINFLGLIQSRIIQIRGYSNFPINRIIKKPSYTIGLICLIPVIGAIVGIIFIADGISKYKDKWFILMGLGGVFFTVITFFFLFYYFNLGKEMRIASIGNSQMQLNTLMKDIEFYKIKNGDYPDSLKQISKDDPMVWIEDPLQSGWGNSDNIQFNYQKVGNHYYLFSSGIDGIPNTSDDIYPQVAKEDSSKFGLMRK